MIYYYKSSNVGANVISKKF